MQKIFCVEDDTNIRELTEYTLNSLGFDAQGFACAKDFFDAIAKEKPALVLLDIMLPDMDGMEILQILRKNANTKNIPVILLTAKSQQMDKIKGLDSGADDYVTKPFDVLELVSRIKAVLRRSGSDSTDVLTFGSVTIDRNGRCVTVDGREVVLTFKEFELLLILAENRGVVLTRNRLMNDVWGTDFEGETRTVDVHIRTLRQKLGEAGSIIETVRNVGYKVE